VTCFNGLTRIFNAERALTPRINGGVNGDFSGHARVYDVCSTNEPTPTPTRATTTLP